MIRWIRRQVAAAGVKEEAQNGVAIVLVAISMVVLIGFAAFAVDFGWLYLNGVRIQHGADAAALSGVVYEPGDQTTAYAEARNSAAENGYNDSAAGTTVTPIDYTDDPSAVDNQYQLAVEIEHSVDTFFMKVFGIDSIAINKRAVAEYVLPLPMGSDLPYFGEDPSISGRDPHFWGNIHGYYTGRTMGDRFSSQCVDGGATSSCALNPDRRPTTYVGGIPSSGGYLYGIEVDAGASNLAVEVFDGPFYRGGNDNVLVGDNPQGGSLGPTTWFILYAPDPTPLNTTDNTVLCAWSYGPQDHPADFNGDGSVNGGDDQDSDGDLDWVFPAVSLRCGTAFVARPSAPAAVYTRFVLSSTILAAVTTEASTGTLCVPLPAAPSPVSTVWVTWPSMSTSTGTLQRSISPRFSKCMPARTSSSSFGIRIRVTTVSRSSCPTAPPHLVTGATSTDREARRWSLATSTSRPASITITCRFGSMYRRRTSARRTAGGRSR